jgi:ribosomal protein S18 acetylase RimI-like enzyme
MSSQKLEGFRIRWMIRSDMKAVQDIEDRNSGRSHNLNGAWSSEDFLDFLRQPNSIGMVAVCNSHTDKEKVIGYMLYQLYPDRIHIFSLVVDPDYVHLRVGTSLMDRVKSKLSQYQRKCLEIDIRESNFGAQMWLKALGFKAFQVVRDWYKAPEVEDAYKFRFLMEDKDGTQLK